MTNLSIGALISQNKVADCRREVNDIIRLLEGNSNRLGTVVFLEKVAEDALALAYEARRGAAIIRGRGD
jgi:hypothetical protein